MKYKKADSNRALAFQNTIKFKGDDINIRASDLYKEIKAIYNDCSKNLVGKDGKPIISKPFSELTKTDFEKQLRSVLRSDNKKYEQRVVDVLYEDLKTEKTRLNINDGFNKKGLFNTSPTIDKYVQNLFFLHGVFHIYKEKRSIYKITKTQDKALYERLDEILSAEDKDIVCVFTNTNKMYEISGNEYLKHGIEKLKSLEGSIVIIGSSLGKNDNHIFTSINNSRIEKIYYASIEEEKSKHNARLKELFPEKTVVLFDRETITYENGQA